MDIHALFETFKTKKVIVLGDVMLDAYIIGKVSRISPEAPVPIVNFDKNEERLGGAANVALNLSSLGAKAYICSVVGKDDEGQKLIELLVKNSISAKGIVKSENRKTTVKTRVIGNNQQLLRIDSEQINPISSQEEQELYSRIEDLIESGIDTLIFQDYNKGTLSEALIQKVIALCNENNISTSVDPKKMNFFAYNGVTLFKPNLKELKEGIDFQFSNKDKNEFKQAVEILRTKLKHDITFITLSEDGVYIKDNEKEKFVSAHLRNIADVSGAGDTVISLAALCLASDLEIEDIAEISNLAGGLVCEKPGVVSINKDELMQELVMIYKQ
jgi:D-glycero-beta-D-manno-heptose-7-phosphate kinase